MSELFLNIVNMSISATYIALAVMVMRLLLKKAPKKISLILWGIVGIRLIMPFTVESIFSLMPSAQTLSPDIIYAQEPVIYSGIPALNHAVNPIISESFKPNVGDSANPLQILTAVFAFVWVLGMAGMLIYTLVSCICLKRRVNTAILLENNIYKSERVDSPFVFGFFKPKIYLPCNITADGQNHVVSHEKSHIKSFDHIIKPIGFIILALHWFNPVIWISYILFCKDIELACDERVIKNLDKDERANYSQALLCFAVSHRSVKACPLAFGEVSVKNRVKSVIGYKKPALWIILLSVIVIIVSAVCFLTNPKGMRLIDINDFGVHLTMFDNVSEIIISDGFYSYSGETTAVIDRLMQVEISKNPVSQSRNEGRAGDKQIIVNTIGGGYTVISFDSALSEVWLNDGVKPTFSYKVLNPDTIKDIFDKRLTLDDVIELSKKKDELSWADFNGYYHIVTGSGLYIEQYPIDDMFYVSIGGSGNTDEKPMYIYLTASDGFETMIDIRNEDVQKYIDEHKDNIVVKQVSFAFQSCAVGYSDEAFAKLMKLNQGVKPNITVSHVMNLPLIAIRSTNELNEFLNETDGLFGYDHAYEDTRTLNEALKSYNDVFFNDGEVLLITYVPTPNTSARIRVERIEIAGDSILSVHLAMDNGEQGDTARDGFLVMAEVSEKSISQILSMYAVMK